MTQHPDFKTKGSVRYSAAHEWLNDYIKLSTISVNHLIEFEASGENLTEKMKSLISDAGEKWIKSTYDHPLNLLANLKVKIAQSGIMWVYSAFDVYLNHVDGICSKKSDVDSLQETHEENEQTKLYLLFDRYGWSKTELEDVSPVFEFYTEARNCIVHSMGKASSRLAKLRMSDKFSKAILEWKTVIPRRKLSPAPEINDSNDIVLNPHHAITYSDTCLRIVRIIDQNVLMTLNIDLFVVSVAKKYLLNADLSSHNLGLNMYNFLRIYTKIEFGFDEIDNEKMRSILIDFGLYDDCNGKYQTSKKKQTLKTIKKK